MDEKQKKQLEIIQSVLADHNCALSYIYDEIVGLAQKILRDVTAFEVISGKSELILTASALMSLAQQVEQLMPDNND